MTRPPIITDETAQSYWKRYMERFETKAVLPMRNITSKLSVKADYATHGISIKEDISGTGLFYCAWAILLHLYNDHDDIWFGIGSDDCELPVHVSFDEEKTVGDLVRNIEQTLNEHRSHIREAAGLARAAETEPPFDSLIAVEEHSPELPRHPLHVTVSRSNGIQAVFRYNERLFAEKAVSRLARHYEAVLQWIAAYPNGTVSEIEWLSPEEQKELLVEFNDTDIAYTDARLIQERFEQHAAQTPDKTAVFFRDTQLTYGDLNRKANRLARLLRAQGVGPEQIVGIATERSFDMFVAVMAVIKAGGAYLPLDRSFPDERIEYMLANSGAKLIVTDDPSWEPPSKAALIDANDPALQGLEDHNLQPLHNAGHLAYVIYTSGSTGQPKGVMVEHRQVVGLINYMNMEYNLLPDEISVHRTNLTFDPSVWEMFWPICCGAAALLLTKEQGMDARHLLSLMIGNEKIKMIFMPSSLVKNILYLLENSPEPAAIRLPLYHFGAEPIDMDTLLRTYPYLDGTILNTYGPTECTVFNTYYYVDREDSRDNVPIGKPIANNQVYILSRDLRPMPVHAVGEICIAGDSVSRGYIHDEARTAEKFVDNPFGKGKLYRTGDRGRWLEDGNIEIIGRIDHQVKIRGHRIEPGEIERAIRSFEGTRDCTVLTVGEGEHKQLRAFVIAGEGLRLDELKQYLSRELPSYMMPSAFKLLDHMPLTVNGKIDRERLRQLGQTEAPDNRLEASVQSFVIATVTEALQLGEPVGLWDRLADRGLNSLLFTRIVIDLESQYPIVFQPDEAPMEQFDTAASFISYVLKKLR